MRRYANERSSASPGGTCPTASRSRGIIDRLIRDIMTDVLQTVCRLVEEGFGRVPVGFRADDARLQRPMIAGFREVCGVRHALRTMLPGETMAGPPRSALDAGTYGRQGQAGSAGRCRLSSRRLRGSGQHTGPSRPGKNLRSGPHRFALVAQHWGPCCLPMEGDPGNLTSMLERSHHRSVSVVGGLAGVSCRIN